MSRYRQTMAEALNQVRDRDNNIEEGRMKDIFTADQEGKSAKEIAKLLNIPLKTVKSILGESDAYDNERYEIRGGIAYKDIGNTPDKKNHVYAPDKKTAEKIFKQGKKVFREAGIKPYVSMQRDSKTGKMNYVVLDKDEKEAFKSTDQRVATDYWKKNYDKLKEETIVEFSDSMLDKLKKEYEPLKGKTISVDQANKLRKIFSMIPDRALDSLRRKKIPFLSGLALSRMVQKGMPVREEIELDEASSAEIMKKAKEFGITVKMTPKGIDVSAFKSQDGMDKFMKYVASQGKNMLTKEEIEEKIQSFMISYSKNGQHAGFKGADSLPELQRMAANLRMRGFTIDKMGRYNPPVKKEEVNETPQGYALVQKAKEIAKKMAGSYSNAVKEIEKLQKGLSDNSSVKDALLKANEQVEQIEKMPKEEPKKDNEKKEEENKNNTIASLKDQINILKTKLENEKNKAVKPEPNPDTGEVPLTVGVAYKHFKDKKEKEEVKKEVNEATVVSDISGISIPALKRETAKFNIKVARVTPGGPNGAEYEVTFTGAEKDLVAYAKEHFGFDDKPGSFQQLKKHLNMDYVPEKAMSDKEKRLQRAKDMIKYYDAQKKAALKGKNKDLAKKMLKNEEVTAVYTDKKTRQVKSKKFKDINTAKDHFRKTGEAAGQINFRPEEADLSKKQIKMVHKVADDLPKKDFKDRYGKEKGDAVRFGTATNMVKKKLGMKEDRRLYVETIAGLKKKAEKSGMPYSILKKVYDRGMAAWKSGHRPGASQQQWAFARVNSFVTKSSGTWGGADKDLAKQVKG